MPGMRSGNPLPPIRGQAAILDPIVREEDNANAS